jgi:2-polyprenyl-3-methyl-5-hydroxy-6-metoxy-1,4-benzoquinol methylase
MTTPGPLRSWESLAEFWDAKQGDDGDTWHRTLINPGVWSVLGDVRGLRVLDQACGNGAFSRQMARRGAHVVGMDASAPIVALASQREARSPLGIVYHVGDVSSTPQLPDGSFDVVLSKMALMDMPDGVAEAALREAGRLLKPGGRLVAAIIHPCFEGPDAAWVTEKAGPDTRVWRKVGRYREHVQMLCPWRAPDGSRFYTFMYHRPLAWYVRAVSSAGVAVTAVEEPGPTDEFYREDNEGQLIAQVPLHIVFEAKKLR